MIEYDDVRYASCRSPLSRLWPPRLMVALPPRRQQGSVPAPRMVAAAPIQRLLQMSRHPDSPSSAASRNYRGFLGAIAMARFGAFFARPLPDFEAGARAFV